MGFYANISWESRWTSEMKVWGHLCHILVVFEVPAWPQVKEMSGTSFFFSFYTLIELWNHEMRGPPLFPDIPFTQGWAGTSKTTKIWHKWPQTFISLLHLDFRVKPHSIHSGGGVVRGTPDWVIRFMLVVPYVLPRSSVQQGSPVARFSTQESFHLCLCCILQVPPWPSMTTILELEWAESICVFFF